MVIFNKKQIANIHHRSSSINLHQETSEELLDNFREKIPLNISLEKTSIRPFNNKSTQKLNRCRIVVLLSTALITLFYGVGSILINPLEILLKLRLEMTPGLPPFEWWLNPPDIISLRVYIFNITNSAEFLSGTDLKLKVQQIGPIIYKEKMQHLNPTFNSNGTLSYTSVKSLDYQPELNKINLNDEIIVLNLGVIIIPAYFHDASLVLKLGLNVFLASYKAEPLKKMTIRDFLWNSTDPTLNFARKYTPFITPTNNLGLLHMLYQSYANNVTLLIGNKNGNSKFFTIDKYDGSEFLPHFDNKNNSKNLCSSKFRNSSEGVSYPQMIEKTTNLTYWKRIACKQVDVRYVKEEEKYGITGYRFEMVPWQYSRIGWENNEDCYAGNPVLPNGVSDVSACYWDFPFGVSFPHFLNADLEVFQSIEGLRPNPDEHGAYTLIEPMSGIPLEQKARSQINLIINDLKWFPDKMKRFSNKIIPLCWLEYHQEGLPPYLRNLVYFLAVILPTIQLPLSVISLILGLFCLYLCIRKNRTFSAARINTNQLIRDFKLFKRESEKFIFK